MPKTLQAGTYWLFVERIAEIGDWVSRAEMAKDFNVHQTTAIYHLDTAVRCGALVRIAGYVGRQPGWLYGLPDWQAQDQQERELPF